MAQSAPLVNAFADFDPLAGRVSATSTSVATNIDLPAGAAAAVRNRDGGSPSGAKDFSEGAATTTPAPAPQRRSRRHRKRGAPTVAPSAAPKEAAPQMAAPWEEDTAQEAAEQREANRQALRKAIRNKQQMRSSRQAISESATESAGGMGASPLGFDPAMLNQIDSRTLQALMKKAGVAPSQGPSVRKFKRAAQGLSPAYLSAIMGAGNTPAGQ